MKAIDKLSVVASIAVGILLLAGCERPPMDVVQSGYRGVAIEQVSNPRIMQAKLATQVAPEPMPAPAEGTPAASAVYQNVQVLGDLSVTEFTRLMTAMTQWVSPTQGCAYCHDGADFASDDVYTKVVARKMLQMTEHINSNLGDHVGATGVTCYTCHRGNPVPQYTWSLDPASKAMTGAGKVKAGQNTPLKTVAMSSLPYDPFSKFLNNDKTIRIQSDSALPSGSAGSMLDTEATYGLMMHISDSLGVNCTYCHNSRSFQPWAQSSPARVTAWHGINAVRELNQYHIEPLTGVFPDNRKGPLGDPLKINCATCHQGVNKPLQGVSMLQDYPELNKVQ